MRSGSSLYQANATTSTVLAGLISLTSPITSRFIPHALLLCDRLVSATAPSVLSDADELVVAVGDEFAGYTAAHIRALRSDSATLRKTTLQLCRSIKCDAGVTRPVAQSKIRVEKSAAFSAFLCTLVEVRNKLRTHLCDTAEHDAHNRENHEKVLAREQKAVYERVALESQLKVESRERRRQVSRAEEAESRIREELGVIFKSEAAGDNSMETNTFGLCEEELTALLRTLQVQLSNTRNRQDDMEAVLQKKVSDNEKKLASNLADYDDEVGSIEATLREETGLFKELNKNLDYFASGYESMRRERESEEEARKDIEQPRLAG